MALKKVRPQDLVKNGEQIMKAAQEGRLYLAVKKEWSEDEVKNHVHRYVSQIGHLATAEWRHRADYLWRHLLALRDIYELVKPKPRARKCREFDKYGVMRLVGFLRSLGVYEDHVNDSELCEALEHSGGDCCYRSYIGIGIESRALRKELKRIVAEF